MKAVKNCWFKVLPALLVLFVMSCKDTFLEDEQQPVQEREGVRLNSVLDDLDLEAGIVIVQNGESIQEAVKAARSGNTIYVEPGVYKETLTIDKPDIRIIGLKLDDQQVVVENPGKAKSAVTITHRNHTAEIVNIQFKDFEEGIGPVSQMKHGGLRRKSTLCVWEREELGNGIAHYHYKLRVGTGEFDVVGLHRVVKEYRPYHPVRTKGDIFMIHGTPQDFDDIFLTAGADLIHEKTSAPFYLADRCIDVWGIDLGWTLVPEETADFSFMEDWGMEKEVDHILSAMAVSRLIRGLTRQGFQRMNLLGYSSGGYIAYGAAGRESQLHPILRHVKGIIPVDAPVKYDNEDFRQVDCDGATDYKAQIDAGVYQCEDGQMLVYLSTLALDAPDDPSPIPDFEGLTNRQVMMLLGSSPFDMVSQMHLFAGTIDTFYHTDPVRFFRLGASLPPYMPNLMLYEMYACGCNEVDVSLDDHIDDISLPILNIGTVGGFGDMAFYTSTLTKSNDITDYLVSIPGVEESEDYAHADIWLGYEADEMLWSELYEWLIEHSGRHRW